MKNYAAYKAHLETIETTIDNLKTLFSALEVREQSSYPATTLDLEYQSIVTKLFSVIIDLAKIDPELHEPTLKLFARRVLDTYGLPTVMTEYEKQKKMQSIIDTASKLAWQTTDKESIENLEAIIKKMQEIQNK